MEGKVTSQSVSNEISIQNARKSGAEWIMAVTKGESMNPKIKPETKVPIKLMSERTEYKKGDIIAFKRGSIYVIHEVMDSYVYKGTTYYVTGGINQITNEKVDIATISAYNILGYADLSTDAYASTQVLEQQGTLLYVTVQGMTNKREQLLERKGTMLEEKVSIVLDDWKRLLQNEETTLDDLINYKEDVYTLTSQDVGLSLTSLRDLQQIVLCEIYKDFKNYVNQKYNIYIYNNIESDEQLAKAVKIIKVIEPLFSFEGYNGLEIFSGEISVDNLGTADFMLGYPKGIIHINVNLELELISSNIIPHEVNHIKIRKVFDQISKDNNVKLFTTYGMVVEDTANEIEEFIVDAANIMFLTNQDLIKYAKQQAVMVNLLLGLDPYKNYISESFGIITVNNNFPTKGILDITRHLVIMKYIKENLLKNDPDVNNAFNTLNRYFNAIMRMFKTNSMLYHEDIIKLYEKNVLEKFESFFKTRIFRDLNNLDNFLSEVSEFLIRNKDGFLVNAELQWMDYICNYFVPQFFKNN